MTMPSPQYGLGIGVRQGRAYSREATLSQLTR